jgi:uncharacterized membrane protein YeaQ/YmgE (transglycosylase-associated protein family)
MRQMPLLPAAYGARDAWTYGLPSGLVLSILQLVGMHFLLIYQHLQPLTGWTDQLRMTAAGASVLWLVVFVLVGWLAARRTRRAGTGALAGSVAGFMGGLIGTIVTFFYLFPLPFPAQLSDRQTIQIFVLLFFPWGMLIAGALIGSFGGLLGKRRRVRAAQSPVVTVSIEGSV